MICYMCNLKTCPHHVSPCEFSQDEVDMSIGHSTICPIGEDIGLDIIDENNTFYCLIVGSRTYDDYQTFCQKTDKCLSSKINKTIIIVSGGAKGTDKMAERYAKEHNYHCVVFEAEWDEYGKKAGYIRNEEMHKYISTKKEKGVIAFWDGQSKGTKQNFELAKKYKNQIRIYRFDEPK